MKKQIIVMAFIAASATLGAQNLNDPFGIGMQTPQAQLHIHQKHAEENLLPPVIDGGNRDQFFDDTYFTTFLMTNPNTDSTGNDGFLLKQSNLDIFFLQRENGRMVFSTPGGKIVLSSTGRFGYGDTVSTHRFNVHGTARFDSDVKMTQSLVVDGTLSTGGALNSTGSLTIGSISNPGNLTVHGNTSMEFGLTVSGATTLQGGLTASGQTSINGPLSVSAALTVGGATTLNGALRVGNGFYCDAGGGLKVKYLKVTLTDWPDYVFGGGHTLMPLNELESYVNEHSHLPGVPSATEIEKDGADLGEINKVLMEKVEELTLYVIDLQKQINELKSKK